jgi:2-methylcitrate dehydratase PrpD
MISAKSQYKRGGIMNEPEFRVTRRVLLQRAIAGAWMAAAGAQAAEDEGRPRESISPLMRRVSLHIAHALKNPLPDNVVEAAKHHLLDTLASMVSGSHLPPGRKAIAYMKMQGGRPEACVAGSRIMTTVVNAAMANGMLAHADETDDSHAPSLTHPGCAIVPAALAMAERMQCDGMTLLRAVTLGYDIGTRASLALGGYDLANSGRDTHSIGTMFGAAAAASAIAGLSADQIRHVISYCAQQAAGLSNYARDTEHIEKAFLFGGMPARNGAAAADMVASGMTGIDDVFTGERNLFFAFGPKSNPEALLRGLGEVHEVVNTNIKRWTVGSPIQAPLDSLSYLIKNNKFKADDVVKAVVKVSHQGHRTTNNRSMPDINMQYMVSVMLLDGTATLEAAHDEKRMNDPRVLEMRKRVEFYGDDELQKALPRRGGIVELTLRDGRTLRHHTPDVRGTPQNPMTREEVDEKCYLLGVPVIGRQRARELVDSIWNIEKLQNVRALRRLLMA